MSKHIGIVVGPKVVELVRLTKTAPEVFAVEDAKSFKVPVSGARHTLCKSIYDQVSGYLENPDVRGSHIIIKQSATTGKGGGDALLLGAEIRGVVQLAAANSGLRVTMRLGAQISKMEKGKKFSDYCDDDAYWIARGLSEMKKGLRDAALLVTAEV